MVIILRICEMLSLIDRNTAYICLFSLLWLPVLIIFTMAVKPEHKKAYIAAAIVPVLNFACFYALNHTKGDPGTGISRYCPYLITALVYCIGTVMLMRGEKRKRVFFLCGEVAVIVSVFAMTAILVNSYQMHYGNFSHYGYERSMAALIDELEGNYISREHKEIDFDMLREVYIPMAARAEEDGDEAAFAQAVAELCYEFHDGHLRLRYNDAALGNEAVDRIVGYDHGFSMLRLDDGSVIAILADGSSESFSAGIHNGTVITSWNGEDIDTAIDNVKCIQPGVRGITAYPIESNEDIARPIFLAGQGGETVTVGFIDDEGTERTVTARSMGSYQNRLREAAGPITGKHCFGFATARMLEDGVGYLCIPEESFDALSDVKAVLTDRYPEVKELVISRIEELKSQGMETLILDLRDNDGGIDVVYEEIVTLFTNEGMTLYGGYFKDGELVKSSSWIWTTEPDGRYSDLPVIVLVNAGCGSCGDIFASFMSRCPNVTMMGITTTWGSAQTMGGECLLSGGSIRVQYPIIGTLDEDGKIYLDAGPDRISSLELDERIPLDLDAVEQLYAPDSDYELSYALEYIRSHKLP